jgi:hypothetical protein
MTKAETLGNILEAIQIPTLSMPATTYPLSALAHCAKTHHAPDHLHSGLQGLRLIELCLGMAMGLRPELVRYEWHRADLESWWTSSARVRWRWLWLKV